MFRMYANVKSGVTEEDILKAGASTIRRMCPDDPEIYYVITVPSDAVFSLIKEKYCIDADKETIVTLSDVCKS
jgi:hypothetical protein